MKNLIDPMYYYCDCDSDNRVTVEEMWKGLRMLKNDNKYNFYNCVIEKGYMRTSAINDFMLKGGDAKQGQLTVDEFRQAVLIGYWNRHTTVDSIITDSTLSKRDALRWPGGKDLGCQEMEKILTDNRAAQKKKRDKDCKMKKKLS